MLLVTDEGIKADPHHGLVKINTKARLRNVDNFFFVKQCQQVYYTHYFP